MLPSRFQTEGLALPSAVPDRFERFYRARLRRRPGSRVRSSALLDAYRAWAVSEDEAGASFNDLGGWMRALGHRRLKSNGIYFADAVFATDAPGLPDNFRIVPAREQLGAVTTDQVLALVDQIDVQLRAIRRALDGGGVHG